MLVMLPISTLRALSVDDQDKMALEAVKMEKRAKESTDAHRSAFPSTGKLVCVFEERLNDLKTGKKIASNTSLSTYWESITKTKMNSHASSCAVAFGTFVRTELMSEADYDKNTGQCLELAASISTAVGGDVTNEYVHQAAEVLRNVTAANAKKASQALRDILANVKEPKALDGEKAKEMLARILASGFLTTLVIPSIGAEIAHLTDVETGKSAFLGIQTALGMFAVNVDDHKVRRFTEETMDSWIVDPAKRDDLGEKVKILNAGVPVPTETAPEVSADILADVPGMEAPETATENATSEAPASEAPVFMTKRERRRLAAEAAANAQPQEAVAA